MLSMQTSEIDHVASRAIMLATGANLAGFSLAKPVACAG